MQSYWEWLIWVAQVWILHGEPIQNGSILFIDQIVWTAIRKSFMCIQHGQHKYLLHWHPLPFLYFRSIVSTIILLVDWETFSFFFFRDKFTPFRHNLLLYVYRTSKTPLSVYCSLSATAVTVLSYYYSMGFPRGTSSRATKQFPGFRLHELLVSNIRWYFTETNGGPVAFCGY